MIPLRSKMPGARSRCSNNNNYIEIIIFNNNSNHSIRTTMDNQTQTCHYPTLRGGILAQQTMPSSLSQTSRPMS